ncbi:MAG: hypothetical protein MK212_05865 [Saprospiraceae bacterium]|nr:hypothetical protein [Saprospiraceae bacterium]
MKSTKYIWVFNAACSRYSGGNFENLADAEHWIQQNKLTGVLSKYPLNMGVLDWAIANDIVNMKPEKLALKQKDPNFVGGFTSASMEHHHYENGISLTH